MTDTIDILRRDGVAILPTPVAPDILALVQQAFAEQLTQRRWNTTDGYEQNERWRRLVEDLFLVHPQFLHIALRQDVLEALDIYFDGAPYQITEARGWETIKTRRQFHNWHNDAWYDPALPHVPRQVKLGVYLTDVTSGYFSYVKGSHKEQHRPDHWNDGQVDEMPADIFNVCGPAGTMFLFDTCGIHRQSAPVREPRHALMFNFHDPATPIQSADQTYGRYETIKLDVIGAASLNARQRNVLGLDQINSAALNAPRAIPGKRRFPVMHATFDALLTSRLLLQSAWHQALRPIHAIKRRLPSQNSSSRNMEG